MSEIILSNGQTALVSPEDYDRLNRYAWAMGGNGYAVARVDGVTTYMHHLVLPDVPSGMVRDHINRNRLDNRRENLRVVSMGHNTVNTSRKTTATSGYRGVIVANRTGNFLARIGDNNLGEYRSAVDAAYAYDYARRVLYAVDDGYNFPDSPTPPEIAEKVQAILQGLATGRMGKKYRGTWQREYGYYVAECGEHRVGTYYTEEDAARARDRYILDNGLLAQGKHYALNFPVEQYEQDPELGRRGAVPEIKGVSQYLGVARKRDNWRGYIFVNGRQKSTGVYATEREAAEARERYIIENGLTGTCALNFP
jgi:hypothetical protein